MLGLLQLASWTGLPFARSPNSFADTSAKWYLQELHFIDLHGAIGNLQAIRVRLRKIEVQGIFWFEFENKKGGGSSTYAYA